jgi:membrane-associated phospholipid phosphatase
MTRWSSAIRILVLGAIALVAVLVVVEASRLPYFPTDVAGARAIQSFFPIPIVAAKWMMATANVPWCFSLFGLSAVIAWMIGGWRAALMAVPIFFGLWLFGIWLSPHVAQPRPSPDLITVVGHLKGYAFPSIFGLVYAATFGYVGILAAARLRGAMRVVIPVTVVVILIFGACARIVLGAHWPSDLWGAYLMGFLWIELFMALGVS